MIDLAGFSVEEAIDHVDDLLDRHGDARRKILQIVADRHIEELRAILEQAQGNVLLDELHEETNELLAIRECLLDELEFRTSLVRRKE